MKDFFVSYNKNDRAWAEWIAWQIEESGYTALIQAWDFRPGGNFVLDMHEAAANARRTIAVLSPNYLGSPFTASEWAAAFAQDPTGAQGLLVPVRVRECEPGGLLPQIVYIDLVGLDERDARECLLQGVKSGRAKPPTPPLFPGKVHDTSASRPSFPGSPAPVATAALSPARLKAWMLAAMIDKKLQAKHLWRTAKRTGRLAYLLIGHEREWPEALAYRLALDLAAEDIARFHPPAKLSVHISALDRVRDSFYNRLAGKLQGARDESLALVERLRLRLTEEKDPLVFFVNLAADEEPRDIAAALAVLLRAWEELLAPIAPLSRHYLVLTLGVVQESPRWFDFWRSRYPFERYVRACGEALVATDFAELSLPAPRSPMRRDVVAWLEECVESFHPNQADEVRDAAVALFDTRPKIAHWELKAYLDPYLKRLT